MTGHSFYIPSIGNMSERDIARAFQGAAVGIVDRVDFFENSAGVLCAFVHFEELYNNNRVNIILHGIANYGSCKFWFNNREFFILREMICPKIPATAMNIHQIADKLAQQEAKIAELEAKILAQDEIIATCKQRQLETIGCERLAHRAMWTRSPSSDSYDVDVDEIVNSLVGPRWPEEDDDSGVVAFYPEETNDYMSIEM